MENAIVTLVVVLAALTIVGPVLRGKKRDADIPSSSACGGGCKGCSFVCNTKTAVLVALGLVVASPAVALDTVEHFDHGPTNAEYYLGYGGFGRTAAERELSNEIVLGIGLTDRLSTYLGSCVAVDQQQFAGETSLCFGLMATPFESDHFDLDLLFDVGAAGDGLGSLSLSPWIELNYDDDPDMGTWGLYLRSGFSAYGQGVDPLDGAALDRLVDFGLNPGAYYRITENHELLFEADLGYGMGSGRDASENVRGVAIGLNSMVSPSIELITQLHRDVPRNGDDPTWSMTLGFIATLGN